MQNCPFSVFHVLCSRYRSFPLYWTSADWTKTGRLRWAQKWVGKRPLKERATYVSSSLSRHLGTIDMTPPRMLWKTKWPKVKMRLQFELNFSRPVPSRSCCPPWSAVRLSGALSLVSVLYHWRVCVNLEVFKVTVSCTALLNCPEQLLKD